MIEHLHCDICGDRLDDENIVLTRFLSSDCNKIKRYGQICRKCYSNLDKKMNSDEKEKNNNYEY